MYNSIDQACFRSACIQQHQLDVCQYTRTELANISLFTLPPTTNTEWVFRGALQLEETRQYTKTQALKAALKTVGATALALVTLAAGGATGVVSGTTGGAFARSGSGRTS